MNDQEKREKVIKGLKCCASKKGICALIGCPYYTREDNYDCIVKLTDDAIALLKALEPIEPIQDEYDKDGFCCGICGAAVGFDSYEASGICEVRYNYCPNCGKAVAWG